MSATEVRFDRLENRLNEVFSVMEKGFAKVHADVLGLKTGFYELSTRIGKLEVKVEDMHETLCAVEKAIDINAVAIIDHERRITVLEKVNA